MLDFRNKFGFVLGLIFWFSITLLIVTLGVKVYKRYENKRLICFMVCDDMIKSTIYVSPHLYYSGSNNEIIKMIDSHFKKQEELESLT